MCDTIKIKGEEGESMKPIKLKELIATAKDPATQKIVIAEGYGFDIPLFDGVVKDADLTPPTIEIVGFLGGGGKAYHHAAYKAASYAVSHQQLRV